MTTGPAGGAADAGAGGPAGGTTGATTDPSAGTAVVLCHGGPGLWDNLAPVADLIDPTQVVHRYDQRGCGRSTGPDDYRLARAVADLDALRAYWGHEQWIVFGHSWGATLALAYAWTHPERTRAVIYCGGVGPGSAWREPCRAESARRLTPEQRTRLAELEDGERTWEEEVDYRTLCWLPDYADPATAEAAARAEAVTPYDINWRANRGLATDLPDVEALAPTVRAPTLILHGEADPRPLANTRLLLDLIPRVRLAVVPDAGHSPWVEARGAVAAELRAFLTTI
ncbi:alpha/beta hydrolase [Actinopolymorpha sp. B17G11]|uniref:alpha/beta fold hydrolase n=1 Tax=Actinopolymorpha sp. B17G11 TaxID=3160861 RepID=UPI0032E52C05